MSAGSEAPTRERFLLRFLLALLGISFYLYILYLFYFLFILYLSEDTNIKPKYLQEELKVQ